MNKGVSGMSGMNDVALLLSQADYSSGMFIICIPMRMTESDASVQKQFRELNLQPYKRGESTLPLSCSCSPLPVDLI